MKLVFAIVLTLLSALTQAAPLNADPALRTAQRAIDQQRFGAAIQALRPLAVRGHFGAQMSLARLYELPIKDRNLAASLHWFAQAARHGSAEAMEAVALAHYLGRGTPADARLAAEWFRLAAQHGAEASPYILATLYEKGEGVPQDLRLARAWYDKAARLNDLAAAARRDALDLQLDAEALTAPP
jgi:TPR repeat protein